MVFDCIHLSKLPLVVLTYQKLPLYNKQLAALLSLHIDAPITYLSSSWFLLSDI